MQSVYVVAVYTVCMLMYCGAGRYIKPMWNILIVNCITDSCVWNTGVTWQGIDYKLSEDDTVVSKHVAVW